MKRLIQLIFFTIFISNSLWAQTKEPSIICLGYVPNYGNIKLEIFATPESKIGDAIVKAYKEMPAKVSFELINEYTVVVGQSMLGGRYLTSFIKSEKKEQLVNFRLHIVPHWDNAASEYLRFYQAPYYHAEVIIPNKGKEVSWNQLENNSDIIVPEAKIVCKQI